MLKNNPGLDLDEFLKYLIKDAEKYLNDKNKLVYESFTLSKKNNQIIDPSENYLLHMGSKPKNMVILSIDIVESTKLSEKLSLRDNAKIITIFSRAIGAIVHNFNGYTLKYIGDGIIAFFSEKDKSKMHNNAILCAYTMKRYLLAYLNPLLKKNGFTEIQFRIGINSGKVIKTIVGYNKVKQHFDLIGETINLATKIQKIPINNEILLGESTSPSIHNFWKSKLKKVKFWRYSLKKISSQKNFNVYILDVSDIFVTDRSKNHKKIL